MKYCTFVNIKSKLYLLAFPSQVFAYIAHNVKMHVLSTKRVCFNSNVFVVNVYRNAVNCISSF